MRIEMSLKRVWLSLFLLFLACCGCGKYAPPYTPEILAPRPVEELNVVPKLEGVSFEWLAPSLDGRGKALKSMDGYLVYRKQIEKESDIVDDDVEFEMLEAIEDNHLDVLEQRKEEARKEGKPTRRVKVEREFREFSYTDLEVEPGRSYVYKIVPFNQGDVEGQYTHLIRIAFRGEASQVRFLDQSSLDETRSNF